MRRLYLTVLFSVLWWSGCGHDTDSPSGEIAVTNSYLHAMVRDLCGDETGIFSVVPPGMCPGHFDIKPGDVRRLHRSGLLVAFDFQQGIARVLPDGEGGPVFAAVAAPPGMCIPDSYLSMTGDVAEILMAHYPQREAELRGRLEEIAARLAALEDACFALIASEGLDGAPVLASVHQAAFAEWLGLRVVGTFSGSDSETAANINAALGAGEGHQIRGVIANRQEGTRLADALGERLDAPVAVFSNFPDAKADRQQAPAFDALVHENLRRLVEAVH